MHSRLDLANHLHSRTGAGGNVAYTYDGNGTLVKRTDTSTGAWTVYIGGIYEVTNTGTVTKYYSALGRTVAMRQAGALYWLLSDHLGSNSVVTDGVGLVVGSVKYGPYGGVRSATGSMPTDKLYTGQRREVGDALGLYDYKARFYSTVLGRFLGADPVAGKPADPQTWNPYSYARNSPLRYSDPTGQRFDSDIEADHERYEEQQFDDDVTEQQAASDWASQGSSLGIPSCEACDTLVALAAAGLTNPDLAQAAAAALCAQSDSIDVGRDATPAPAASSDDGGLLGAIKGIAENPVIIGAVVSTSPLWAPPAISLSTSGAISLGLVGAIAYTATIPNDAGLSPRVRLQAQGGGVEKSVVLNGTDISPVTVEQGLAGLQQLSDQLTPRQLSDRGDAFRRAERFIVNAAAGGGVGPPGASFALPGSDVRVDVEVLRGINFQH